MPVVRSVKVTLSGLVPLVGVALNAATGTGGVTVMYASLVSLSEPPAFVAVSRTAQVPVVKYSIGFCDVLPLLKFAHELPPLLDLSQSHDVGVFVDASVKVTPTSDVPLVGVPLKSATGAAVEVT